MTELTAVQLMLLEVYRVHRRPGYPGSVAGSIKHRPDTCRKCALLAEWPEAFEVALPWAIAEPLLPHVGHGRAISTTPERKIDHG
jgi:hypothetical protein